MSLTIDPRCIPPEGLVVKGSLLPESIDLGCEGIRGAGPLAYELKAEIVGREVLVRGKLCIRIEFPCSRCLKPAAKDIRSERFIFSAELRDSGEIDLTERVREDIIIALPIKPLCAADCKGLCPRCGRDLNKGPCGCAQRRGDMRWEALEGVDFPPEE